MEILDEIEMRLKKNNKILVSRQSDWIAEFDEKLKASSHRAVVAWALGLAIQDVWDLTEYIHEDPRAKECLYAAEAWAQGRIKMHEAQQKILVCHAIAKDYDNPVAIALAHAVGQACSTVHTVRHGIGLPIYEITADIRKYGRYGAKDRIDRKLSIYTFKLNYWNKNIDTYEGPWADFLIGK